MINFIVNFFDYFHKKKIIKKINQINPSKKIDFFFDVGAHKGESIILFNKYLLLKNVYSFEPSKKNFQILSNKIKNIKKNNKEIFFKLENSAVGNENKNVTYNYLSESSSSTLKSLNEKSKYFRRKEKFFGKIKTEVQIVKQIHFFDYININNIKKIDFLKIDTEGYEYEVIKGLDKFIYNVKMILFEHHYDDMLVKGYKYSDISRYLKFHGFKKVFKIRMPFRKSFEYIFIREDH